MPKRVPGVARGPQGDILTLTSYIILVERENCVNRLKALVLVRADEATRGGSFFIFSRATSIGRQTGSHLDFEAGIVRLVKSYQSMNIPPESAPSRL